MKIEYLLPSQYHYLFECKVTNKFLIRTKHFVLHTIFFAIFFKCWSKMQQFSEHTDDFVFAHTDFKDSCAAKRFRIPH